MEKQAAAWLTWLYTLYLFSSGFIVPLTANSFFNKPEYEGEDILIFDVNLETSFRENDLGINKLSYDYDKLCKR